MGGRGVDGMGGGGERKICWTGKPANISHSLRKSITLCFYN